MVPWSCRSKIRTKKLRNEFLKELSIEDQVIHENESEDATILASQRKQTCLHIELVNKSSLMPS
jgi:hypothetical protein